MAASQTLAAAANTTVQRVAKEFHGIVVSAGKMDKTVKVKYGGMRYEPKVQKYFKQPRYALAHDPRNSTRQGDVVAIAQSWRESQHVRHVVRHIIAPYGPPISERPPVPTLEERVAERAARREAKDERRAERRRVAILERAVATLEDRDAPRALRKGGHILKEVAQALGVPVPGEGQGQGQGGKREENGDSEVD
ncbi:hypothetical protein SLS62_005861 [Diatrype stigma]|uniref:Mitochondrial ribosomal protein S17 n=1 Tax=Diatrype stigma TaxID=117547 RepID=A0AAN9YN68_9PEZI